MYTEGVRPENVDIHTYLVYYNSAMGCVDTPYTNEKLTFGMSSRTFDGHSMADSRACTQGATAAQGGGRGNSGVRVFQSSTPTAVVEYSVLICV